MYKTIFSIIAISLLIGCGGSDDNDTKKDTSNNGIEEQLPSRIDGNTSANNSNNNGVTNNNPSTAQNGEKIPVFKPITTNVVCKGKLDNGSYSYALDKNNNNIDIKCGEPHSEYTSSVSLRYYVTFKDKSPTIDISSVHIEEFLLTPNLTTKTEYDISPKEVVVTRYHGKDMSGKITDSCKEHYTIVDYNLNVLEPYDISALIEGVIYQPNNKISTNCPEGLVVYGYQADNSKVTSYMLRKKNIIFTEANKKVDKFTTIVNGGSSGTLIGI